MEERTTRFILVIGYNGTGKTTIVKKLVANELKKESGRVLIVTPDIIEWDFFPMVNPRFPQRIEKYVKARRIVFQPGTMDYIQKYVNRQLLVFDDCRAYIQAATDQDLLNLLIRRRQREIDIVAVGHGFTQIPPQFFTFCSDIILFKTMDNIDRRKDVLKDFELMKAYQQRINKEAEKDPHFSLWIKQQ